MSEERQGVTEDKMTQQGAKPGRFLGSLKDALAAASRDDTQRGPAPTGGADDAAGAEDRGSQAAAAAAEPVKADAAPARRRPAPVSALPMRRAR